MTMNVEKADAPIQSLDFILVKFLIFCKLTFFLLLIFALLPL